jgi:hypothetical protein
VLQISLNLDIIVLDGNFTSVLTNQVFLHVATERIFLVTCTSGQSPNPIPEIDSSFSGNSYVVTLEQHTQAYLALVINGYGPVPNLNEKYYYAGGSARFFWRFRDLRRLIGHLTRQMDSIANYHNFFVSLSGEGSYLAIDSLKLIETVYLLSLVNSLFVRCLKRLICSLSTPQETYTTNPSWQGWVAELEVMCRVKQVHMNGISWQLKIGETLPPLFSWKVNNLRKFAELIELMPASLDALSPNYANRILFIPTLWCNKGYDAIFVRYEINDAGEVQPYVYIIQVTVDASHDYLLQYVSFFLQRLFPLDQTNGFLPVIVKYLLVTRFNNFTRLHLQGGYETGREYINNFDATFNFPASYAKCYF